MAARSEKLWLIGYDATTIFRVWDPVRRVVRTSRDVVFNETELAHTNRPSPAPATTTEQPTSPTNSKNEGPTTRSSARRTAQAKANAKATTSETVGVAEPTSGRSTGIAVVMPTRDQNIVYEDWNEEDPPLPQAHFAQSIHHNEDQPSYEKTIKGPNTSL